MEIQKHKVWDVASLDEYRKKILEDIYLKSEVPEEIRKEALIVEKLMIYTYYEYAFIDVAMLYAIITLEKALKFRFEELNPNKTAGEFYQLINWFIKNKYVEDLNPDSLHSLRGIRNTKVHDKMSQTGGLMYLKAVYKIFDYINDLYEDKELRIKRHQETKRIHELFEKTFDAGFVYELNGKRWIGFKVVPTFLNNKIAPNELTLSISQIFPPKKFAYKNGKPDNIELVKVREWQFKSGSFVAKATDENSILTINQIEDEKNHEKYEWWLKECDENKILSTWYFEAYERYGYNESLRAFYRG